MLVASLIFTPLVAGCFFYFHFLPAPKCKINCYNKGGEVMDKNKYIELINRMLAKLSIDEIKRIYAFVMRIFVRK